MENLSASERNELLVQIRKFNSIEDVENALTEAKDEVSLLEDAVCLFCKNCTLFLLSL